jgi:hypothetical protein
MTTMDDAAELAQMCREALNQEIYGGLEPGDSSALSDVWPTIAGAAFTIGRPGGEYAVIIAPAAKVGDLATPHYGDHHG